MHLTGSDVCDGYWVTGSVRCHFPVGNNKVVECIDMIEELGYCYEQGLRPFHISPVDAEAPHS